MRYGLAGICLVATVLTSAVTSAVAGQLSIVGTGDGLDMLKAVAERYSQGAVQTTVVVPPSIGSGGGIVAVASGRERMGRVARPLTDGEKAEGIRYMPIARIPSIFFVHPGVGVGDLAPAQLADVFSGRVTNWKDVGGADRPIRVVRREEADSTLLVLRQSIAGWRDLALTPQSKTAMTTQEAIQSVANVEGAIGFGPYSPGLAPVVQPLKISGQDPMSPGYPSGVVLALIYKPDRLDSEMSGFLAYVKSDVGKAVIREFGAVPMGD